MLVVRNRFRTARIPVSSIVAIVVRHLDHAGNLPDVLVVKYSSGRRIRSIQVEATATSQRADRQLFVDWFRELGLRGGPERRYAYWKA